MARPVQQLRSRYWMRGPLSASMPTLSSISPEQTRTTGNSYEPATPDPPFPFARPARGRSRPGRRAGAGRFREPRRRLHRHPARSAGRHARHRRPGHPGDLPRRQPPARERAGVHPRRRRQQRGRFGQRGRWQQQQRQSARRRLRQVAQRPALAVLPARFAQISLIAALRALVARAKPIPVSLWHDTVQRSPLLAGRDAAQLAALAQLSSRFLARKTFSPVQGMQLDDAHCLLIAAHACLPVLTLGFDYLSGWREVIVYPGEFRVRREHHDDTSGIVTEGEDVLLGEAWEHGPLILSWADVHSDLEHPHDGLNVVIPEIAHKLALRHGAIAAAQPSLQDCRSDELVLTQRGKEVPLHIAGDRDGAFAAGARIEWLGEPLHGPESWFDAYSLNNVYLLSAQPGTAHARTAAVPAGSGGGGGILRQLHLEEENLMIRLNQTHMKLWEEPDFWHWAK